MRHSPVREERGRTSDHAFFALMNAIDDALIDECRWPSLLARLTELFHLPGEDTPQAFPSCEDIVKLRKFAAVAAWSQADAELFAAVCSRLESAARVRAELASCQIKWQAALHALDHVGRGVVLVDRSAKVLMTNTVAKQLLDQRDGLYLRQEHLMTTGTNHNAILRRAIEAVASHSTPSAALPIPRPSLRQLITLVLTPANATVELVERGPGQCDLVLVFVNDPERKVSVDPTMLCRMYGLTRAEAVLACHILAGESLEEAAQALEITVNTARTHLKRIFLKTDTNRQSQLVLLLIGNAEAADSVKSPGPLSPSPAGERTHVPSLVA